MGEYVVSRAYGKPLLLKKRERMNVLRLVPVPVRTYVHVYMECNDIIERVTFMTTKYAYSPESISRSRGCGRSTL